jgi:hypothetical protein
VIKPFVVNFKFVILAIIIAAVIGFLIERNETPIYHSEMVVKPYFDSKYQLNNNIEYLNRLISNQNFNVLTDIFSIDSIEAKSLKKFTLEQGPESPNDLFVEYNDFIKNIDTSIVDELTYEEYTGNRNFFSGSVYTIRVSSKKNDIFSNLENGIKQFLVNDISKQNKGIRDSIYKIQIDDMNEELLRLDSIQNTYLEVLKAESQRTKLTLDIGGTLPLQEGKSLTKEYELFLKEQEIRRGIRNLKSTLVKEGSYFEILSGFDNIGSRDGNISKNLTIMLPLISIFLMFIVFFGKQFFTFIKNYE